MKFNQEMTPKVDHLLPHYMFVTKILFSPLFEIYLDIISTLTLRAYFNANLSWPWHICRGQIYWKQTEIVITVFFVQLLYDTF